VSADPAEKHYEIDCPHCHKHFTGTMIEGGAARYRGFKCPHCKLFVPFERADTR
jgi:phage FluMu protein Com